MRTDEARDGESQLKLLGVDFGEPFDVRTFSGSSRYIWAELQRRNVLVDAFTPYPKRTLELSYKLRAFRPNADAWRASWRRSVPFRQLLSKRACKRIRTHYAGLYTACLQIGAYYDLSEAVQKPRGLLADNNCAISQRTNLRFQSSDFVYQKQYAFEKQVYRSMDCVFCFSEFLAKSMIDDFGCSAERVHVVGAGINVPESLIRNPERDYSTKTILFAGFDWSQKGGPALLSAFSIVRQKEPHARLVLLGPELPTVPSGVTCLGALSKADPSQFAIICGAFREATVFVLPTLADAFPNVIREAMAAGLPCIASDIGSIPEMVIDGVTGHLVPVNDPDTLADRILGVIQNPERARAMGAAGYERYSGRFTWSRVCDHIVEDMTRAVNVVAESVEESPSARLAGLHQPHVEETPRL
jgi:alpha-maltose-1-phosphate synthase